MGFIIAITTIDDKKKAEELAEQIIKSKLGACVQITEIKSIYSWKGKIESTKEFKLEIKTTSNKFSRLKEFIIKNHKYDLPEIIATKIVKGNKKYLNWVKTNIK